MTQLTALAGHYFIFMYCVSFLSISYCFFLEVDSLAGVARELCRVCLLTIKCVFYCIPAFFFKNLNIWQETLKVESIFFLQETNSTSEVELWWKSQWAGYVFFSHRSEQRRVVKILVMGQMQDQPFVLINTRSKNKQTTSALQRNSDQTRWIGNRRRL